MASPLKTWRQTRREAIFWQRARVRSESMKTGELLDSIDLAVMTAGQAISRCRNATDEDARENQLFELRMNLEAALGMLDNLLS